jgi:2-(1,2-epoxy-1,2-dihydrophenyl)acetyl-CoA isomerase
MSSDVLLSSRPVDGVLQLTLNRPDVLNAISADVQRRIDVAMAAAAEDPKVRAVVLAGAGGKALSAGYDIHELTDMTEDEHTLVQLEREELLWRWLESPVPTVVACTGITYGAGMLMATCADLRIGSPATRIKVTATMYGGANLTWLLDTIVGATAARDMLLTSRVVAGAEASRIGFFSRYVADDEVLDTAIAAAAEIAANDPVAVSEVKRLLLAGVGRELRARYDNENTVMLTTLRPKPMKDMFASFLRRKG